MISRPHWRARLALLAMAWTVAAGAWLAPGAGAQAQTSPPPASPSAPPFWARPKQAPPPSCDCDTQPQAPATTDRSSRPAILTGLLSGAGVVLLFVLWRRLQPRPEEAEYVSRAAVPAPAVVPPPDDGLDPRARARAQAVARGAPKEPAKPEEFVFADPRTVQIELAQAEPEGESDSAKAFYSDIAASLQAALRGEPARQDLRRKLLEIYFAGRQVNEFVNLAHEYLDQNKGFRDQFWPEIGAMGARLAPEHELFHEYAGEGARSRPAARRVVPLRRFHERNVDQGKLYTAQQQLANDFQQLRDDKTFQASLSQLLADSVRRPAPLTASPELAYVADGAQIFIKHEDRRRFHDDVMINVVGQLLVAQRLGRTRVVTATRDGILGHAVAGAASRLGLESMIYIGERDLNRYYARVLSMRRLGAQIRPIPPGTEQPLPDPRRSALEAWSEDPAKIQYVTGLTAGPSPFPEMVRDFLGSIGRETVDQMQQMVGAQPKAVVTGVCDGHLGLGLLQGFLDKDAVQLYCVEEKTAAPAPEGESTGGESMPQPRSGGLLARREHRWLRETGRVSYVEGQDHETLRIIEQFHATGATLYTESARTMAHARSLAREMDRRDAVVVLMTNQEGADFRAQSRDW